MINGKEYGWEDITAYMGGRDVMGFRSIKYTTKKEKEALYGKGNKALAIQLDIVVSYGDPEKGDLPTIHKLRGVQFTEDPRETNQGDKFQDLKLPFLFLRRE